MTYSGDPGWSAEIGPFQGLACKTVPDSAPCKSIAYGASRKPHETQRVDTLPHRAAGRPLASHTAAGHPEAPAGNLPVRPRARLAQAPLNSPAGSVLAGAFREGWGG